MLTAVLDRRHEPPRAKNTQVACSMGLNLDQLVLKRGERRLIANHRESELLPDGCPSPPTMTPVSQWRRRHDGPRRRLPRQGNSRDEPSRRKGKNPALRGTSRRARGGCAFA